MKKIHIEPGIDNDLKVRAVLVEKRRGQSPVRKEISTIEAQQLNERGIPFMFGLYCWEIGGMEFMMDDMIERAIMNGQTHIHPPWEDEYRKLVGA